MAEKSASPIDMYATAVLQGCLAARPDLTLNPSTDNINTFMTSVIDILTVVMANRQQMQALSGEPQP